MFRIDTDATKTWHSTFSFSLTIMIKFVLERRCFLFNATLTVQFNAESKKKKKTTKSDAPAEAPPAETEAAQPPAAVEPASSVVSVFNSSC